MGLTVLHQILYFSNKQEYKYDVSLHQVESCINIFPALPLKERNLYLKVQFIFIAKCISVAKFGKFTFDAMG